jgi:membrane fusion protein, multidrug efflux system
MGPMKTNRRIWALAVLGLIAVVGVLAGIKGGQIGTMIGAGKNFVPPPESVTSAKVVAGEWQASRAAIGTLVAVHGVTVGAELPGLVREVAFESGAWVKKGQVLLRLDTSTEEAQLAAAVADAALARISYDRAQGLRQADSNSQADLDAAEARSKQADAAVATLQATIAKKIIRAPFDGRVAIRQVERGQVLSPGTPVASLQSVNPIYVDFWLPQQALADLRVGQAVRMRTDIFPTATWEGQITVVNPEVDVATRNVRVRATIANADGRLRPGMFANVEVVSPEKRPVLMVPATAVLYAPYGDSIFALEEQKDPSGKTSLVARQKFVRLGERRGDLVAVTSGLTAGQTVVGSGAFKLRNGATVVLHNELAPQAELSPKPADR